MAFLKEISLIFSQVITIVTFIGIITAIVKNPIKQVRTFFDDYNERALYDILNFEQDLRRGELKNELQYKYIISKCDDYLKAGKNGQGKLAIEYILKKYQCFKDEVYNQKEKG